MQMPEYIPIPAFAERAGVSRQAVYKRIDKDLQTFVKLVDGKKLIDTNALTLFGTTSQPTTVDQPADNQSTDAISKLLTDQVNQLSNQLAVTVDMLQASQGENRKLTGQLVKLTDDFADLAKQSNSLASQAHSLQGHMQQQTLGRTTNDNETTVGTLVNEVGEKVNQPEPTVGTQDDPPRGNWFTRIFK